MQSQRGAIKEKCRRRRSALSARSVLPAQRSGWAVLGRTSAWRRISALKAAEWRKETQNGTEQGRLVEQRCSPGVQGDLPKTLKNLHVVIKGGASRARRRTWVKLLLDWIETLG